MGWNIVNGKHIFDPRLDVARAREVHKFAISVLQGRSGMVATRKGRLHIAMILKEDLSRMGAPWQVENLEYWIHRFQRGDFNE